MRNPNIYSYRSILTVLSVCWSKFEACLPRELQISELLPQDPDSFVERIKKRYPHEMERNQAGSMPTWSFFPTIPEEPIFP